MGRGSPRARGRTAEASRCRGRRGDPRAASGSRGSGWGGEASLRHVVVGTVSRTPRAVCKAGAKAPTPYDAISGVTVLE
eukprot:4358421-Prymnesium_polylepis.1